MHHNIEPYDRRYKSLVLNFFVTDVLKQPGDEEYKKLYTEFDCFFSMRKKLSSY